jgi:L-ribulose-5-phosphate 3-epimerase
VALLREYGLHLALENHPEKNPVELLAKLGSGDDDLFGVAVDTGWFGTQGYDAAQAIHELGPRVFHVHLKDVRAAGAHQTCRFGQGIVPLEACVQALHTIGYTGTISVEHEPETFDPTEDCVASAALLRTWLQMEGAAA